MRKFIRRLLLGAAAVWGYKMFQDKRRDWSGRPAEEVRREVMSKLPDGMDAETKQKVADKVVQAVKGSETTSPAPTPSGSTTPPPETPMSTPPSDTQGLTTPVPPPRQEP
ncbi:MAG TPA: hypothetical protein VK070_02825 [Acidimicrobiia bacterium]|nr:hypothetical protein [Acidimicrobiia bacterium]